MFTRCVGKWCQNLPSALFNGTRNTDRAEHDTVSWPCIHDTGSGKRDSPAGKMISQNSRYYLKATFMVDKNEPHLKSFSSGYQLLNLFTSSSKPEVSLFVQLSKEYVTLEVFLLLDQILNTYTAMNKLFYCCQVDLNKPPNCRNLHWFVDRNRALALLCATRLIKHWMLGTKSFTKWGDKWFTI